MSPPVRIAGLFCIAGGLLFAFAPTISEIHPPYLRLAAISPLLLLIGSFGLWKWTLSTGSYNPTTKAGHLLLTLCLIGGSIIGVVYSYAGPNAYLSVALFLPSVAMALGISVGTGIISMWAVRNGEGITLLMSFFMIIPFFDPLLNHAMGSIFPYGFSFYGVAWALVGAFISLRGVENSHS